MERRMEILIIGGNRFVGKKVAQTLYKEHNVTVLNRKGTSPVECNIIQQDRNELKELPDYDIVIDMCLYNLEQTKNIVDILKKQQNLQQYIFISSIASELEFFGEYGKQKHLAEKFIMYSDLPWTILKPTYVLGIDNPHDRESYYIKKLLNNEIIEVEGEGDQPLSFVFSEDIVKVICKIIEEKVIHKTYNLCNDDVVTLKEFITIISDVVDKKPNIQYNSKGGPFENKKCTFANNQIKNDLNIEFKPLKQGITDYYEWYKIPQS
jgi:nucleoside-diphosphate-sugar epimerase